MFRDDFALRVRLGLAISLASATNAAAVTVAFQGGTVRLAHTPDSGNGAIVSSQAPVSGIPVPVSRLDSGGYSLDASNILGSSNSFSKAKAAHVTNSTTASIALRRGTGITQTDPSNNYLGFSRTELNITSPLIWNFGTDKFFPAFSRYASFTVAGNVGTGGFARFNANLTFRNAANVSLGSLVLSTGTITTVGPFARTLTAAGPLSLLSGDQLRMTGTITFDVSNDEGPSDMLLENGEVGGSEGETYIYNGGSRNWATAASWTSTNSFSPTPTLTTDRVVFAGSSETVLAGYDLASLTPGTSMAFGTIDVSGINKLVDVSGGSLATSGGFIGRPNFRTGSGSHLRVSSRLLVSGNGLNIDSQTGSTIEFNNSTASLGLASGFAGSLNIAKTGGGIVKINKSFAAPVAINAEQGEINVGGSGVAFTAALNAQPQLGETATIRVDRPVALTGLHVYDGGTIRLQRFGATINSFRGGDLFVEDGGVLDLTNTILDLIPAAGTIDPYDRFRDHLITGYANGAWNGPGITSSFAAADSTRRTALGYMPAAGDVRARIAYALYGDADLSGAVSLDDFTTLAANFGAGGDWANGDFNYNGAINLDDFTALAANFGLTLPTDLPRSAVPEPSALAIVMAIPIALVAKRRRRTLA